MDAELSKILERLEALKKSADRLGTQRGQFLRHLEIAEAQLEAAKHELKHSKGGKAD